MISAQRQRVYDFVGVFAVLCGFMLVLSIVYTVYRMPEQFKWGILSAQDEIISDREWTKRNITEMRRDILEMRKDISDLQEMVDILYGKKPCTQEL